MFDGASNVKLGGRLLKARYPIFTVMRGVEHTVSLFFNIFSKITIVNKRISSHKMVYNVFGSGIYHKPHSIFKSKYKEFHNINIGLFSGNQTRMAGYFMGIHRDLRMQKVLQDTISSAEFISIPNNNKFTKAISYIHDNKSWERCYVLLKIIFPRLIVFRLVDSNLAGMDKVYYYLSMTKQCTEKNKLILTIREFSLTYRHQPIYGSRLMTKVMKKSQYQIILLRIQTIFVLSYQIV